MPDTMQTEVKNVSIDKIRSELRALWASEGVDGEAVIRARSHNLVVYTTGSQDSVDDTIQRIIEISAARPGRVILIQADPGAETSLDAWVTVYCQLQNRRQVCGEMIVLVAGGALHSELHSTVVSLLASDVPVYMWWMVIPSLGDHLFTTLTQEADRIIVDSDNASPAASFDQLSDLLIENPGLRLGDLAWARLTPWRRHVAALWDIPELHDPLNFLRTLDVVYVATQDFANAARAFLLVGWLADRFDWELAEAHRGPTGGYITRWRKWQWEGKVELVESSYEDLPPGEIVSVYLQAGQKPPFVMPRIEYVADRDCIDIRLNDASPSAQRRGARFSPVSTAAALVEELDQEYDPYYVKALMQVAIILQAAN